MCVCVYVCACVCVCVGVWVCLWIQDLVNYLSWRFLLTPEESFEIGDDVVIGHIEHQNEFKKSAEDKKEGDKEVEVQGFDVTHTRHVCIHNTQHGDQCENLQ